MFNVQENLSSKKTKVGSTFFIAIDGHGGAGKSTLAKLLSKKLSTEIIHTDDFASWENPFNWWPSVIEKIFEPIQNGAKVLSYDRSQWGDRQRSSILNQAVTKVMILEGVGSLRKEFRDYVTLGFFVDTPKELCLQRGLHRDLKVRKIRKNLKEAKQMWSKWFKEETKYLNQDNPKAFADVVLDGTRSFEDQFE
jgi:uridine kinase